MAYCQSRKWAVTPSRDLNFKQATFLVGTNIHSIRLVNNISLHILHLLHILDPPQTLTMAQNSTKGLNPKSASGGRKKTGLTKKGKRDCAPKQIDRARQAASMKVGLQTANDRRSSKELTMLHVVSREQKLSSSINNSIERQMVQAASTGAFAAS